MHLNFFQSKWRLHTQYPITNKNLTTMLQPLFQSFYCRTLVLWSFNLTFLSGPTQNDSDSSYLVTCFLAVLESFYLKDFGIRWSLLVLSNGEYSVMLILWLSKINALIQTLRFKWGKKIAFWTYSFLCWLYWENFEAQSRAILKLIR